jgi:hypothetical protein
VSLQAETPQYLLISSSLSNHMFHWQKETDNYLVYDYGYRVIEKFTAAHL